jgi:hypothetical protein
VGVAVQVYVLQHMIDDAPAMVAAAAKYYSTDWHTS